MKANEIRELSPAELNDKLAALKSELASLSASLPAAKGTIKAEKSGYFVSKTDGYEQSLTADILDTLTPEKLDSVKAEQTPADVIGRIVSDYEWYIAAKVSINESLKYKEGDSLTIYTSVKSYPQMPVTVKKINISESSSSVALKNTVTKSSPEYLSTSPLPAATSRSTPATWRSTSSPA